MKIAIAGYNGFIGKSFVEDHPGWEYIHLTRELLYGDPGDLTAAIGFIMKRRLEGVFNLCATNPVENSTFTKILARETGAPVQVRVPVGLLKIMMGKAHKLVSGGQHVIPARLLKEEFRFRYPDIETAIRNLLQER